MSLPTSHSPVKVLIADDSSFMRAALSRMVESDGSLCVVGTAHDGQETLAKIGELHPDVVTLDLDMPGLNGLETLKRVMSKTLRPAVIIVSALARQGAEATLEALELGAFDCVAKQLSYDSADVVKIQSELVGKIKAAAGPRLLAAGLLATRPSTRPDRAAQHPVPVHRDSAATVPSVTVIAIATSTGGPKALEGVLSALPADLQAAILIVQHMPLGFAGPLVKRLNELCKLNVGEAEEGDVVTAGHVYLAPTGKHLMVRRRSPADADVLLHLTASPSNLLHIPSADVMMSSVAEVFGSSAMGIILTGMGDDGALGMQAIFHEGGLTLGQDQETCVVYGMPRCCAEMGVLNQVAALPDIPLHILAALRYRKPH